MNIDSDLEFYRRIAVIFVLFVIAFGMICAGKYGADGNAVPTEPSSIITHAVD
jgi:hypothetical protein